MMEQPVQDRGGDDRVAEDVATRRQALVAGHHDGAALWVVPCTCWSAIVTLHSSNQAFSAGQEGNRRPARTLRLTYFTPDSTFPFVWGR
jgi:hypothetical protein